MVEDVLEGSVLEGGSVDVSGDPAWRKKGTREGERRSVREGREGRTGGDGEANQLSEKREGRVGG